MEGIERLVTLTAHIVLLISVRQLRTKIILKIQLKVSRGMPLSIPHPVSPFRRRRRSCDNSRFALLVTIQRSVVRERAHIVTAYQADTVM